MKTCWHVGDDIEGIGRQKQEEMQSDFTVHMFDVFKNEIKNNINRRNLMTISLVFEGKNRMGKVENPNRDKRDRENHALCNGGWQATWWKVDGPLEKE